VLAENVRPFYFHAQNTPFSFDRGRMRIFGQHSVLSAASAALGIAYLNDTPPFYFSPIHNF